MKVNHMVCSIMKSGTRNSIMQCIFKFLQLYIFFIELNTDINQVFYGFCGLLLKKIIVYRKSTYLQNLTFNNVYKFEEQITVFDKKSIILELTLL